jgi:hypothetical protein
MVSHRILCGLELEATNSGLERMARRTNIAGHVSRGTNPIQGAVSYVVLVNGQTLMPLELEAQRTENAMGEIKLL